MAVLVEPVHAQIGDVDHVGATLEREVGRHPRHARAPHHPVASGEATVAPSITVPSAVMTGPRIGRWSGV